MEFCALPTFSSLYNEDQSQEMVTHTRNPFSHRNYPSCAHFSKQSQRLISYETLEFINNVR